MIGQTINNRYTITERLGKGAMGTVYRASDNQNGQVVAVKIIASDLAVDPSMLERFKREGETLRQLKHRNIVGFIDAFQHDEQYVIVMEYVSGGSLYNLLKTGPLPIDRATQIALDLCDALISSHRLKIIHRDIKPENVLIEEDGTPKLADFGVARLSEGTRMTRSGMQVGTPYYMAPEAWEGKVLDTQADIWSLGVMLFEMVSGQLPFAGDTPLSVMSKVNTTPPPDLRKLRSDVPSGLVKIISRMLMKNKAKRYQSMREVAVDLERDQQTVAIPPPIRIPKTRIVKAPGAPGLGTQLAGLIQKIGSLLSNLFKTTFSKNARIPLGVKIGIPILIGVAIIALFFTGKVSEPSTYFTVEGLEGSEIKYFQNGDILDVLTSTSDTEYWHPAPDKFGNLYFVSETDSGQAEIFVLDSNGIKTQVTNTANPFNSWAPAPDLLGNLYFASDQDDNDTDIYVIDSSGNKSRVTTTEGENDSWSPVSDGRGNLYFVSDQDGSAEIYVIDSDGNKSKVTNSPADSQSWSPAPDGLGNLYFVSDQDGASEIFVIDSNGVKRQVTESAENIDNWSPVPDGLGNLYFTSDRNGDIQVFRMNSKGEVELLEDIPSGSWLKEISGSPSGPDTIK